MKLLRIVVILSLIIATTVYGYNYHETKMQEITTKYTQEKENLITKYTNQFDNYKSITDGIIIDKENSIMELSFKLKQMKPLIEIKNKHTDIKKILNTAPKFKITAYDLSIQSCGKSRTSREFGITASGYKLTNKSLRTASTISTDPNIIPLGAIVYLYFGTNSLYNGIYISSDTGSGIKGYHIDLFIGDTRTTKVAMDFGIKYAKAIILDKI